MSRIIPRKPSMEMNRKAQNVTTMRKDSSFNYSYVVKLLSLPLPHPGSSFTSNSRKITALQQDRKVSDRVGRGDIMTYPVKNPDVDKLKYVVFNRYRSTLERFFQTCLIWSKSVLS